MESKRIIPLIIGIDIGIGNNCGLAGYLPKKKEFLFLEAMDIFDALDVCLQYQENEEYAVVFVVENADLDSNVFGADVALLDYLVKNIEGILKRSKAVLSKIRIAIKTGENVGKNKGLAKVFVNRLNKEGCMVAQVAPSQRDRKGKIYKSRGKVIMERGKPKEVPLRQLKMPTKINQADFTKLTGCTKKTNEHIRDGAMLVYGKDYFYWTNWARTQKV
jgi:hypothetical protein